MSTDTRQVLWVHRGPGAFPEIFSGNIVRSEHEGRIELSVSQVKKYTWENYHGKSIRPDIAVEEVLWKETQDISFCDLVQTSASHPKQSRYDGADGLCVVVETSTKSE